MRGSGNGADSRALRIVFIAPLILLLAGTAVDLWGLGSGDLRPSVLAYTLLQAGLTGGLALGIASLLRLSNESYAALTLDDGFREAFGTVAVLVLFGAGLQMREEGSPAPTLSLVLALTGAALALSGAWIKPPNRVRSADAVAHAAQTAAPQRHRPMRAASGADVSSIRDVPLRVDRPFVLPRADRLERRFSPDLTVFAQVAVDSEVDEASDDDSLEAIDALQIGPQWHTHYAGAVVDSRERDRCRVD